MKEEVCQQCGMFVVTGEYHPFAACLMFKGCHDSDTVRKNLLAVVDGGKKVERERCARICDNLPTKYGVTCAKKIRASA